MKMNAISVIMFLLIMFVVIGMFLKSLIAAIKNDASLLAEGRGASMYHSAPTFTRWAVGLLSVAAISGALWGGSYCVLRYFQTNASIRSTLSGNSEDRRSP